WARVRGEGSALQLHGFPAVRGGGGVSAPLGRRRAGDGRRVTSRRCGVTISKATAPWEGNIKSGKGVMKAAHAPEIPFSLGTRFEGQPGSNPEEIIGAALAGCFSMALSLGLERAGSPPKTIRTSATVKLDKDGE